MDIFKGRKRVLKPATPYLLLHDDVGGQVFMPPNGDFITWDNIKIKTNQFHYTADDDRVQINTNQSGFYEIVFECSYSGSHFSNIEATLYKNGVIVDGADTHCFCGQISYYNGQAYTNAVGYGSHTLTYVLFLEQNDYIQIKIKPTGYNATTLEDSSRLLVKFVPLRGWNNKTAGKFNDKGGVLR